MKTVFACTILTLAFSLHAAQLPPADSFRLTVEEVVQSSACRVVIMKIEARSAEMVTVLYEQGGHASVGLTHTRKGEAREGSLTLVSMLGEISTVCHTVTVVRAGGAQASKPASYNLKRGTELASVVALSVTSGVYKVDRPLVIGERNGEAMRLVVGNWNWDRLSQNE